MKYSLFSALFVILLIQGSRAQQVVVAAPKLVSAAAAFGKSTGAWDAGPTLSFSADGQYVLGFTEWEAKAWHMPEGELVYRFNTSMQKEDKNRGVLNYRVSGIVITADGKYIYAAGGNGVDFVMMPADLETGELVPDGIIKDSLKNGSYQLRVGIRGNSETSFKVMEKFWGQKSPLLIKRPKDGDFDDRLTIYGVTAPVDYPGELLICYSQTFCGSRQFIKDKLSKTVKEVRQAQYSSNGCHFFDVHTARYNPATNTAKYLGNSLKGAGAVDFISSGLIVIPSPIDDIVYVSGRTKQTAFASVNKRDGTVLWEPGKKLTGQFEFTGFNDFGNLVFRTLNGNATTSEVSFEPQTGDLVNTYTFVSPAKNVKYNAKWNLSVAIGKTATGDWTVSMYDSKNGEHMISLSDQKGAAEITAKTQGEIDRINAYIAAKRKEMQDSFDRQLVENAKNAKAYQEKLARDAAYRAAHFKPCPVCKGTGVWVDSGIAKAYRRTSFSEGRAMDGSRTIIKTTESSTGGYWEHRSPCLKCSGRGEVAK